MTGLLQLNPTLPVWTPLGDGEAFLVIDYGPDTNTCYAVRLPGGVVKHVWSDDIRLYGNPMNGNGWDVDGVAKPDGAKFRQDLSDLEPGQCIKVPK